MKRNKQHHLIIKIGLLFLGLVLSFVLGLTKPVEASVTQVGSVYHITTGQDLYNLLAAGNTAGYWSSSNPAPDSIQIAVDNDITYLDNRSDINTNISNSIDVDFQNHVLYVKSMSSSSLRMSKNNLNLNVTVHNQQSNPDYASVVSGSVTVPDPVTDGATTSGYVMAYYSLFSGEWEDRPSVPFTGSLTYDSVDINYPNFTDTGAQMFSAYYVPLKFTGTNNFVVQGNSSQEFGELGKIEIVSGTTTMTYGQNGSDGNYGMLHQCYDSGNDGVASYVVDAGATWNLTNHSNMPTFYFDAARNFTITNNGTFNFVQDGLPVTNSAKTTAFSNGTSNSSTNVTFGPNSKTNMMTTTILWNMNTLGQLTMEAKTGSETVMTTTNTSGNAAVRLFGGNATAGSMIMLGNVKSFGIFATSTQPTSSGTLLFNITEEPLGITGYLNGNTTPSYYYAAEQGSIGADWKTNDNTIPKMTPSATSPAPIWSSYGIVFAPGTLQSATISGNAVWNYALTNSIFPATNAPVWLPRNGTGDNTQLFDIIDSRTGTANFVLQAVVSDTQRTYGFMRNDDNLVALNTSAQTILTGADFTAGSNGGVNTAGHWTYSCDASHGLLVQASRLDKAGTFNGTITYSMVDGLQ
ncbi:MAG: hypothetical protein LBT37_05410 [Lactobacillaceae bacterium]|nr:hypothetical protein [Lactobacillaceae bacterium]